MRSELKKRAITDRDSDTPPIYTHLDLNSQLLNESSNFMTDMGSKSTDYKRQPPPDHIDALFAGTDEGFPIKKTSANRFSILYLKKL